MSWLFSRALVEEYSAVYCLDGEPSAQLNVTPSPHPFLLSDKTTAFSGPSQFGVTCAPLTGAHGGGVLMWFLAGFPVRTSAPPAEAPASTGSDRDSGWKWPGSFAKYSPDSRSWKTRQSSLLEDLASFSETWPRWGSMRDGECSALVTPARPTNGNASGSWPTIRSSDGERGGRGDLIQAVRGNSNTHFKAPRLTKDGLYTTPCADDTGHRKARYAQGGTALSAQVGGALNPTWVEWLMGWPIAWTVSDAWETDRFRPWLLSHGAF